LTRTPTAYVDDAARALRQARTYLADELARIDAALAALNLETETVTEVTIEADAEPAKDALAQAVETVKRRHAAKTYPCTHPGCDFVARSPGGLGGHMNRHRPKPAPPQPVQPEDTHTVDLASDSVTVVANDEASDERSYLCDECGETFRWPTELSRHRRTLGHYQEDKA